MMMREDWENSQIVEAYCKANGSRTAVHGDQWRNLLVNPVIWRVARWALGADKDANQTFDAVEVHKALADHRRFPGRPDAWYAQTFQEKPLNGLTVLDLGCGEAHLGRWLNRCGASYIGLDGSQAMLAQASKRSSKKLHLKPRDLDLKPGEKLNLDGLPLKDGPLLVTGIVLLDHLQDPLPLLTALSTSLAHRRVNTWLCFIVLNPEYFCPSYDRDSPRIDSRAEIHSAHATVNVVFHSRRAWELMLRDARLLVHSIVPLRFRAREPIDAKDTMGSGVPPFLSIVCQSNGANSNDEERIVRALAEITGLGLGQESDALSKHQGRLEVVTYSRGETILGRHNLGGDLFVMLEGKAELIIGGRAAQSFAAGEIFGDVEAGCGTQSTYYAYDVRCTESTKVLRIPEDIVNHISVEHRCHGWRLFKQLRTRLAGMLWRFDTPMRNKLSSTTPWINLVYARRIAREMLASSEHVRQRLSAAPQMNGPSTDASKSSRALTVLVQGQALVDALQQDRKDVTNKVLRTFVFLGYVDFFPGADLCHTRHRQCLSSAWEAAVASSLTFLDEHTFGGDEARHKARAVQITDLQALFDTCPRVRERDKIPGSVPRGCEASVKVETRAATYFKRHIEQRRPLNDARGKIWFQWVKETSQYMHDGCEYVFFTIQDPDALRVIAISDQNVVEALVEASRRSGDMELETDGAGSLINPVTFRSLCENAASGRVRAYLNAFFDDRLRELRAALDTAQTSTAQRE
jgi:SAM-dependent methyltransferase